MTQLYHSWTHAQRTLSYYRDTCTLLFIIARNWNQSRCPSTEKWIMKLWHKYTVKFYSAALYEISGEWLNLESIKLEWSRTQKYKTVLFSLVCGFWLLMFADMQIRGVSMGICFKRREISSVVKWVGGQKKRVARE